MTAVIRKYLGIFNDKNVGWHELQDILNFQPRVIFESYTFYPIWGPYFDPSIVLGWRYTQVSMVDKTCDHHLISCPDFKRGFNCVVYTKYIYSVGQTILDPRLKQLVGERHNLSFPMQRGLKRIEPHTLMILLHFRIKKEAFGAIYTSLSRHILCRLYE